MVVCFLNSNPFELLSVIILNAVVLPENASYIFLLWDQIIYPSFS